MATLDALRWGPASGGPARHLVVLAHGLGADGHDLIDLAPLWAKALPDALFAAPHAPEPNDASAAAMTKTKITNACPARLP